MNEHAKNLRRTRADMLGTDDEEHYWECHAAAAEIERLEASLNNDMFERMADEIDRLEDEIERLRATLEDT